MCKKMHEHLRHLKAAVEGEGAAVISVSTTGGGHRRLDFAIAGKRGVIFFANTPTRGLDLKMLAVARRVVRRVRENGA